MSELKVNKVSPIGTAFQLGESGDTITVPAGATILNSGTATNFGDTLPAYGADGNVLTSTGSAWASEAPGGAAGLVKISTNSTLISTPATLVAFDSSLVTSTYSHYRLVVEGLSVATDAVEIGIKLSVDNGVSFATHLGQNLPIGDFAQSTPSGAYAGNRNYHWFLHEMEATVGTGGGSAYCDIFNANSTTDYKYLISEGALVHYSGGLYYMSKAWSVFKSTSAVNYIKVYDISGGNMDGGKFTLYGYA